MNDPWRFRQFSAAGNGGEALCPMCSTAHFPFCPPPPPHYSFQPPGGLHHGFHSLPQPSQPAPFRPQQFNTPPPAPASYTNAWDSSSRFLPSEGFEFEGFHKRMRVDEPAPAVPGFARHAYGYSGYSYEDERRLNLIRDHGQSMFRSGTGFGARCHEQFVHHDPRLGFRSQHYERNQFERREFEASKVGTFDNQLVASTLDRRGFKTTDPYGCFGQPDRSLCMLQSYGVNNNATQLSMNSIRSPENLKEQMPLYGDMHQRASFSNPENGPGAAYESCKVHDRQFRPDSSYQLRDQPNPSINQVVPGAVNQVKESSRPLFPEMNESRSPNEESRASSEIKPLTEDGRPSGHQLHLTGEQSQKAYGKGKNSPIPVPALSQGHTGSTLPSWQSSTAGLVPSTYSSENHHSLHHNAYDKPLIQNTAVFSGELSFNLATPSKQFVEDGRQLFPIKKISLDKPTVIDARHLFQKPHRASRPDNIVVILRGLPGSGKSYMAKALRDIEVEHGGNAPRIHAMDDYFMIEVEKRVEDSEGPKSSGLSSRNRSLMKKVIEYCYEPEMEETYRASMLKAFKKTLDEGNFTLVIVDDRNLRVADFAQFWAIAKRSGYEVYLLEATYKDPAGCAARNVHGFTLSDIQKMADQWEEAPPLYLKLDIQPLFHGDDLDEHSIQEVEMDTVDVADDEEDKFRSQDDDITKQVEPDSVDSSLIDGAERVGDGGACDEAEEEVAGMKELGKSKWSKDLDEETETSEGTKANVNALSGLIQTYKKHRKSVNWGDQVNKGGFSITAVKRQSISLVIGPGSGYNLKSNPLPDEEKTYTVFVSGSASESKKRFHDKLRAERESFRAVFDRRRHRIGGLNDMEDE